LLSVILFFGQGPHLQLSLRPVV